MKGASGGSFSGSVVALLTFSPIGTTQCSLQQGAADGGFPGVSDWAHATTMWDPDGPGPATPRLVVAGRFQYAGNSEARYIAAWDPASNTWSAFGAGSRQWVDAVAALPNGELVASGDFAGAGGPIPNIARWTGSAWAPLGAGLDGPVETMLVLPNGDLVVGGRFMNAGSVVANRIARWDGTTWHAYGTGMNDAVQCLTVANGQLVAGGRFTSAGGNWALWVAKWDGSAWINLGGSITTTQPNSVECLATMPNGDIVAGGTIWILGDIQANHLARFDGTRWVSIAPSTGTVKALAVLPNGHLVAGGNIQVGASQLVGRWDGARWWPMGTGFSNGFDPSRSVDALTVTNGELVAGGLFSAAGGVAVKHVARWDGSAWSALAPTIAGFSNSIATTPAGDIYVGGSFTIPGPGSPIQNLARRQGTGWSGVGGGVDGAVHAMTIRSDGSLIVGGEFLAAGSVAANRIAQWDGTAWQPLGSGVPGPVGAVQTLITMPNGDLAVGGTFSTGSGAPGNNVARWTGAAWQPMAAGLDGPVTAFAVLRNGDLVAGGSFTTGGGTPLGYVARWDGLAWRSLGSGLPNPCRALALLPNGDLAAAESSQNQFGFWDGSILRWNGTAWSTISTQEPCRALVVMPDGDLVAMPHDARFHGQARRWNAPNWTASPAVVATRNAVGGAMATTPDGRLLVAGVQLSATQLAIFYEELATPCPASATTVPSSCVGSAGPVRLTVDALPWLGATCRATAMGCPANGVVLVLLGTTPIQVPLRLILPQGTPGCDLLVLPEVLETGVPASGSYRVQLPIPEDVALLHAAVLLQVVPIEFSGTNLVAVTSTNGQVLRIGAF